MSPVLLTPKQFSFPTDIGADSLVTLLAKSGAHDPVLPPAPAGLCALGDTRHVP